MCNLFAQNNSIFVITYQTNIIKSEETNSTKQLLIVKIAIWLFKLGVAFWWNFSEFMVNWHVF